MNKHIIIAIRYSILQRNSAAWRAAEQGFEKHVEKILSDERLDIREETFDKITLSSICCQKVSDPEVTFSVLIMLSDLLPKERLRNLQDKIRSANATAIDFNLVTIDSGSGIDHDFRNINEAMKFEINKKTQNTSQGLLATVRLDDDDGLSANFVQKLSEHMHPGLTGYAVSFAYGLEGYWNSESCQISDIRHNYFPKFSAGMAYLNSYKSSDGLADNKTIHVYNLGNHMKIDEYYPTIVEAKEPMFFRTLSTTNDSVGSPYHKNLPAVMGRNTLEQFSYISRLYSSIELMDSEDLQQLEVCKSSSPWMALITHLNNRIQLREKQIRELTEKLDSAKS